MIRQGAGAVKRQQAKDEGSNRRDQRSSRDPASVCGKAFGSSGPGCNCAVPLALPVLASCLQRGSNVEAARSTGPISRQNTSSACPAWPRQECNRAASAPYPCWPQGSLTVRKRAGCGLGSWAFGLGFWAFGLGPWALGRGARGEGRGATQHHWPGSNDGRSRPLLRRRRQSAWPGHPLSGRARRGMRHCRCLFPWRCQPRRGSCCPTFRSLVNEADNRRRILPQRRQPAGPC